MEEFELAWAAGFFDGEGCVTLDKRSGQPVISIAQIDREVLDRFPNSKSQYKYQCSRLDDVRQVVSLLHPYLSKIKREKADRLLANCEGKVSRKARLQETTVMDIIQSLREGETRQEVAVKFGLDYSSVRRIDVGESWTKIDRSRV